MTGAIKQVARDRRREPRFVGIGELPAGRRPDRDFISDIVEVAHVATADAGIDGSKIDTLPLIPCLHSSQNQSDLIFSRTAEELGPIGSLTTNMMKLRTNV